MEECLQVVAGLWSGKKFSFKGEHYHVENMTMVPGPVQKPRIPTWVVGVWPKMKSMKRTLRWDGVVVQKYKGGPASRPTPDDIREVRDFVTHHRKPAKSSAPFDIIIGGVTSGKDKKRGIENVRKYAEAGATWWIESVYSWDPKASFRRIKEGPPRID